MAAHCCWDKGYALLPGTLPQPPALAELEGTGDMAQLGTTSSQSPPCSRQPRQGMEGSAGCPSSTPTGWALPLLTAKSVLLDLGLKINR